MPITAERQRMIATIRDFPTRLEAIVRELNPQQLDKPGGEGDWTIRQVVHHLADSHMNSFIRLKLILTEAKPTLKPYHQEAWAILPDTIDLPPQSSLLILKGLHERWVALFEHVAEADWSRSGYHPELKEDVTVEDLLVIYSRHCDEHIEQINRLLD